MHELTDYSEEAICLSLTLLKGIGPKKGRRTLSALPPSPTTENLANAASEFVGRSSSFSTAEVSKALSEAGMKIERSAASGIGAVAITSEAYPERLRTAADAPLVLFFKGDFSTLHSSPSVAVIGTREPTAVGEESCRRITRALVEAGITVVSGLALGCDTVAHTECLEAGGRTVAVLPCGLDDVYPSSNQGLAHDILTKGGSLVSEYPTGTRANRNLFIQRNRIQSGLSDAVVVIETAAKGGSMATAKFCKNHGRLLAAIDSSGISSPMKDEGNRVLISQGARPLRNREDVDGLVKMISSASFHTLEAESFLR
jgi:DNA processing protein